MMGRTFRNNANLCLFLVAAIVGLPRITHSLTTCSVSDGAKRDCGYFGIDQVPNTIIYSKYKIYKQVTKLYHIPFIMS